LCTLKIQTSESDLAVIASTPAPAKLDGVVITCHDVPLKCSRRGPVPLVRASSAGFYPLGHRFLVAHRVGQGLDPRSRPPHVTTEAVREDLIKLA
jgi:hypothetical protein